MGPLWQGTAGHASTMYLPASVEILPDPGEVRDLAARLDGNEGEQYLHRTGQLRPAPAPQFIELTKAESAPAAPKDEGATMARIGFCVACGHTIAGRAKVCPDCDRKWPQGRVNQLSAPNKLLLWFFVFIVVMLFSLTA